MKKVVSCFLLLFFIQNTLHAIEIPAFFSSGMVLQREEPITFWGFGKKNEQVTVRFNNQTIQAKANKFGQWEAIFPALQAGGPYSASIQSKDTTILLADILIGDVWLCSGQSNMEYPMKSASWAPKELAAANYPNIRIMKVERDYANEPQSDVTSTGWSAVTPESMFRFSAPAYFFGKQLHEEEKVPIGLLLSAYSGSDIISWISESSTQQQFPYIHEVLKERRRMYKENKLDNPPTVKAIREQFVLDNALNYLPFDSSVFENDAFEKTLDIPFKFSDHEDLKDFIGEIYLQKTFRIPSFFEGKSIQFRMARWDDYAEFYINGKLQKVVTYKKDWVMFNVLPQDLNMGGENTYTIRLINLSGEGGTTDKVEFYLYHPVKERTSMNFLSGEWKYKKGIALGNPAAPYKMQNDFAQCRSTPCGTYNAMIHPIKDLKFKGVIWYQGENNTKRAYEYRKLFPAMIQDWRVQLNHPDLSFVYVQLPNCRPETDTVFNSEWAELREAQAIALELPNTAMVTAIDIGEGNDIHPENKQDVGHRLFLAAQHVAYGKDLVHAGPTFSQMVVTDGKPVIRFDNIGNGLIKKSSPYGYVKGFIVAGKDRQFYHAIGVINGNTVELTCPHVKEPVAVRYAWADNPGELNLYNKEGLPATPFRTDDWDGITKEVRYEIDLNEINLPVQK